MLYIFRQRDLILRVNMYTKVISTRTHLYFNKDVRMQTSLFTDDFVELCRSHGNRKKLCRKP